MGAIPEVDPDEPVETKPFKFVTGKSTRNPLPYANLGSIALQQSQWLILRQLVRLHIRFSCDINPRWSFDFGWADRDWDMV